MITQDFQPAQQLGCSDIADAIPVSTAPLINPLHRVVRVFAYLALGFVSLPLGLLVVSAQVWGWAQVFGAIFGLAMLIAAVICGICARFVSHRLKRFQMGDHLVHWTYTKEEWLGFAAGEWKHRTELARQASYVGLFTGGIAGLVLGAAVGDVLLDSVPWIVTGLLGALLLALVGLSCGLLTGCIIRRFARRKHQRMCQRVGEAYIGRDAAYCDGSYWSWTMPGCSLERLELVAGPRGTLQFTLRVWQGRTGTVPHTYRIPVPAGHEEEAREVIARLTGQEPC
jgi:hypothetical protein